ncbi:uncharacterized protein BDZ99DRAFT_384919 [Mytilinidion resinicola]|uniref:Inhibitor I9 domain-containing protein n=1 Tax=Mytilinidion resinicola TaxID=574789 RepID=A0A6A6YUP5_9PEZI|nr:uncharacterized protein BDZ99DRAFT_384919 [Mytilinidion resinicola]KAF2811667.1 hypothetical protein BDZ99DRAFT_384919 [Mytilinidion resinicola]
MARAPLKSVIVSYPDSTPNSVLDKAKSAIVEAGGIITHEYSKSVRAFSCNAPTAVLENVQAWGNEYNALVEEDSVVTTFGGGKE